MENSTKRVGVRKLSTKVISLILALTMILSIAPISAFATGDSTPVTGVSLNKSTTVIDVGANETLEATVAPEDADDKDVTWTSSNEAVATVDGDGKVTGVSVGTATITATTNDGDFEAACTVTVPGIVLSYTEKTVKVSSGNFALPTVTTYPSGQTVSWAVTSGSDSLTYKVNRSGVGQFQPTTVPGSAVATATMTYNSKKYTAAINVTVEPYYVTGITVTPSSSEIYVGASAQLTATVAPSNASVKTVTWTSSNTAVATVDTTGKVVGVSAGTATITATSTDGSEVEGSATVTVTAAPELTINNGYYEISTPDELNFAAAMFKAGTQTVNNIKLMADIDMSSCSSFAGFDCVFTGTFDGNGKTVTAVLVGAKDNFGFIHQLGEGAVVKNLTIAGSVSNTMLYTGAIVGKISAANATITNCTNNATVVGSYSTGKNAYGGIVGYIYSSADVTININNCTNNGTIKSTGNYIGGIVGYVQINFAASQHDTILKIEKCFNNGTISGTKTSSQKGLGGIVGYLTYHKSSVNMSYINECINYGTITAASTGTTTTTGASGLGGIVGHVAGNNGGTKLTIMNCANKANITKTAPRCVGGIIGTAEGSCATVANCFATGTVSGSYGVGTLVGNNQIGGYNLTVVNCYALEGATAMPSEYGTANCTLKSLDYMKSADFIEDISGSGMYRSRSFVLNTENDMLPEIRTDYSATISDIIVNTQPTKTEYISGQNLDLTGIAVYAKYSDNTTEAIPTSELETSVTTVSVGMTEFTVTYGAFSKNIPITVYNVAPTLVGDSTDNTVGQDIELTFSDGESWSASITSVKVDGVAIASNKYTVNENSIVLDKSLFTIGKTYQIVVLATDYQNATLQQVVLNSEGKFDTTVVINDSISKQYDGNPVTNPTSISKNSNGEVTFTFYDATTNEQISAPSEIGSYYVKASVAATDTYSAAETTKAFVITNGVKENVEINKTVIKGSAYSISLSDYIVEGGTLQTPTFNQQKAFEVNPAINSTVNSNVDFTIAEDTEGKNSPTVTINVDGGDLYNDYTITINLTVVEKPSFPEASITMGYGNTSVKNTKSKIVNLPSDATITFVSSDTSVVTVAADGGLSAKALGSATITATITQASSSTEIQISYPVTVEKRTVSVHVRSDYVRYVGGIAPQLDPAFVGKQYTVFGLVNGAQLAGNLTLHFEKNGEVVTPDMNTPGTYDVVASGAAVPDEELYNTDIVYYKGKLVIKAFPSVEKTETIEIASVDDYRAFVTAVAADVNNFADKTVKLTADIDFTGANISTIQDFAGTFDGQNHKISGLANPLFKNIAETAIVENLVVDGNIESSNVTVGIAPIAYKNWGQIINCGNLATVTAPLAAGIVWTCAQNARVVGCFNEGTITGTTRSAAIVFLIDSCAQVKNCYNKGVVSSGEVVTLIGIAYPAAEVINCYNNAAIIANVGDIDPSYPQSALDSPVYVYNCYSTANLFKLKGNILDETTCAKLDSLSDAADFEGYDFENEWVMCSDGPEHSWYHYQYKHVCDKQLVNEDALKYPATCTSAAVYYCSCTCGETGTDTFTFGTYSGHNYVNGVCTACGAYDKSYKGLVKKNGEWIYIKNGKFDSTYTGLSKNQYGYRYVVNGKFAENKTGLIKMPSTSDYQASKYIYIKAGKFMNSYTGLMKNGSYGYRYVVKGVFADTKTGLIKMPAGTEYKAGKYVYIKAGKFMDSYTGIMKNGSYGYRYVVKGVWSEVTGLIQMPKTSEYQASKWVYIEAGKFTQKWTGIATNKYGKRYVKNSVFASNFSGKVTFQGKTYTVKNGKVV